MFDCRNGYKISHPTVYGEKFLLKKIKVPRVNYQWDGDLMDLSNIKEYNNSVWKMSDTQLSMMSN